MGDVFYVFGGENDATSNRQSNGYSQMWMKAYCLAWELNI